MAKLRGQLLRKEKKMRNEMWRECWTEWNPRLTSWNTKISCWHIQNDLPSCTSIRKFILKKKSQKLPSKVPIFNSFHIVVAVDFTARWGCFFKFDVNARPNNFGHVATTWLSIETFNAVFVWTFVMAYTTSPDWRTLLKFVGLQLFKSNIIEN